jgi:hypothetical protein
VSKKLPLCFLYIGHLKEWRSFQTANQVRGIQAEAVLWIRNPTKEERDTVEAALMGETAVNRNWCLNLLGPYQMNSPWVTYYVPGQKCIWQPELRGRHWYVCNDFGEFDHIGPAKMRGENNYDRAVEICERRNAR